MALADSNIGLKVLVVFSMISLGCNGTPTGGPQVGPMWTCFNKSNSGLLNNNVNAILTDGEGITWIATDSGVYSFSKGSWNCMWDELTFTVYGGESGSRLVSIVTSIALGPDRSLWFGLAGGGVSRYNQLATTTVWKRFTSVDGLPSDYVNSITAEQMHGEIWCSTLAGVGRFIPMTIEGGVWEIYNTLNSTLPSNIVRCVAYNPIDFSIWFGTEHNDVTYINGDKEWQQPITFPGMGSYPVVGIAFDVNTTWFATWDGIVSFAPKTSLLRKYVSDNTHGVVPIGIVNAATTDYWKVRWFGTNAGLVRLNDTSWTRFDRQNTPQLPSDTITAVAYDIVGNLWVGTINGVAVYNESGTKF